MTRVVDRLIERGLAESTAIHEEPTARAAEEPPTATVPD